MIRAIPSNAYDNIYCTLLAQSAVHGTMAGFTGFTVGPVNSRHAYIPINVSKILYIGYFFTSEDIFEENGTENDVFFFFIFFLFPFKC